MCDVNIYQACKENEEEYKCYLGYFTTFIVNVPSHGKINAYVIALTTKPFGFYMISNVPLRTFSFKPATTKWQLTQFMLCVDDIDKLKNNYLVTPRITDVTGTVHWMSVVNCHPANNTSLCEKILHMIKMNACQEAQQCYLFSTFNKKCKQLKHYENLTSSSISVATTTTNKKDEHQSKNTNTTQKQRLNSCVDVDYHYKVRAATPSCRMKNVTKQNVEYSNSQFYQSETSRQDLEKKKLGMADHDRRPRPPVLKCTKIPKQNHSSHLTEKKSTKKEKQRKQHHEVEKHLQHQQHHKQRRRPHCHSLQKQRQRPQQLEQQQQQHQQKQQIQQHQQHQEQQRQQQPSKHKPLQPSAHYSPFHPRNRFLQQQLKERRSVEEEGEARRKTTNNFINSPDLQLDTFAKTSTCQNQNVCEVMEGKLERESSKVEHPIVKHRNTKSVNINPHILVRDCQNLQSNKNAKKKQTEKGMSHVFIRIRHPLHTNKASP